MSNEHPDHGAGLSAAGSKQSQVSHKHSVSSVLFLSDLDRYPAWADMKFDEETPSIPWFKIAKTLFQILQFLSWWQWPYWWHPSCDPPARQRLPVTIISPHQQQHVDWEAEYCGRDEAGASSEQRSHFGWGGVWRWLQLKMGIPRQGNLGEPGAWIRVNTTRFRLASVFSLLLCMYLN